MKSRSDKIVFKATEEEPKRKKQLGEKVKSKPVDKKPITKPNKPKNNKDDYVILKQDLIETNEKVVQEEKIILNEDKQLSHDPVISQIKNLEQEDIVFKEKTESKNNELEVQEYENHEQEEEEEEEEEVDKKKKTIRPRISKKPYQDKVILRYTNFKDEDFYNL
jgi:hypothetical protein